MSIASEDFIVIIDYFSKFITVNKLTSKTASSVISQLKNIFAITGLPLEIFSDNGPPFNSSEFKNFAKKYDIQLTTSSPLYPRSNRMAERAIQTVKSLMIKAYESKTDPFVAILNYNSTPKKTFQHLVHYCLGEDLEQIYRTEPNYSNQNTQHEESNHS